MSLTKKLIVHGTMLKIHQCGVLITGQAGVGKSALALGLIDRGHQLISDDAVEIIRTDDELITQRPALLKQILLIRGIGLMDIAKLYGKTAVTNHHPLNFLLQLNAAEKITDTENLLEPKQEQQEILGITVSKFILQTGTSQNLALFVDVLIKNSAVYSEVFPD